LGPSARLLSKNLGTLSLSSVVLSPFISFASLFFLFSFYMLCVLLSSLSKSHERHRPLQARFLSSLCPFSLLYFLLIYVCGFLVLQFSCLLCCCDRSLARCLSHILSHHSQSLGFYFTLLFIWFRATF
jgi:hypothetical protein